MIVKTDQYIVAYDNGEYRPESFGISLIGKVIDISIRNCLTGNRVLCVEVMIDGKIIALASKKSIYKEDIFMDKILRISKEKKIQYFRIEKEFKECIKDYNKIHDYIEYYALFNEVELLKGMWNYSFVYTLSEI